MNKKILLLVLTIFFFVTAIGSVISIETLTDPPHETKLELFGDLAYNAGPNSIEAYFNSNMVVVIFHQDFGYVDVILVGEESGTVYNQCINTSVQTTVYIPITGVPEGRYTLILNNSFGYSEGEFEKE